MVIKIGFINQTSEFEKRVGITPEVAKRLLKTFKHPAGENVEIYVEAGAGGEANFADNVYTEVGVNVVSREVALQSDYVGFIDVPNDTDLAQMKSGATAIGLFNSLVNVGLCEKFKAKGIIAIDMNLLPRQLSMAQSMDAMTSQSSVAGYKAVLLASHEYSSYFPMLTTAAGTIKPASVLILGAGIAGLQAVGTAKRLGAVVTAFDVRPAAKEEIESLGGKFLDLSKYGAPEVAEVLANLNAGQGEGGYARALTDSELVAQKAATDAALKDFDIVITTAQVPGRKPPQFISAQGVKNMKSGSVIIDCAASDLGGNVEGSQVNKTVNVDGVKLIGAPFLSSNAATSASNLLARNICDVFNYFATKEVNSTDELKDMLITGVKEPEITAELEVVVEPEVPNATETAVETATETVPEAQTEGGDNKW